MSRAHPIHHRPARAAHPHHYNNETGTGNSSGAGRAPIHAQRFRTKLCDKFATTGSCPYVHRCMFAHGEVELRTAGQNVADGLVNETSIRKYKRAQYEARKRHQVRGKAGSISDSPPAVAREVAAESAPVTRLHHAMPTTLSSHHDASFTDDDASAFRRHRVPSVASLLARTPGEHDDDDDDDALYGAVKEEDDAAALSDSGNAFHSNVHQRQQEHAVTPAVPRFRRDPYSVECPARMCTPKKAQDDPALPPASACRLPPSLVDLRAAPSNPGPPSSNASAGSASPGPAATAMLVASVAT